MIRLLPRDRLLKTGPVDHADWNYRPLIGTIQRLRFHLVDRLVAPGPCNRLLEVGYGSGVFLPHLATLAAEVHGIDVHEHSEAVRLALADTGVVASLRSGGAERLPFAAGYFDCVVAISCLEFVSDLDSVCQEVHRVLAPRGRFIVVTPGTSIVVDAGLRLLTGVSARHDFGGRRETVIPTLARHFTIGKVLHVPRVGSSLLCLYHGLRLEP